MKAKSALSQRVAAGLSGLLLACTFCISTAFAADGQGAGALQAQSLGEGLVVAQSDEASLPASGNWGSCPWSISADGVLRIGAGTGADAGYTSPWAEYADSITSVIVSDGAVAPKNSGGLFASMTALESADLRKLDVSGVENMASMFGGCKALESVQVDGWDTRKVRDMSYMFYSCSKLQELDLSSFETPQLEGAFEMFYLCTGLRELDLANFDVSGDASGNEDGRPESFLFRSFSLSRMRLGSHSCYGGADSISGIDAPDISSDMPWRSEADGKVFTSWDALMRHAASAAAPQWYTRLGADVATGENGSCTWSIDEEGTLTIRPTSGGQGELGLANITGTRGWWTYCYDIAAVKIKAGVKANSGSLGGMFSGESNLVSADLSGLDASGATTMVSMFENCASLKEIDLSSLDTSKVTRMYATFKNCLDLESVTLDGKFDTSKVTTMESMFEGCEGLASVDLTGFDTRNADTLSWMFYNCTSLNELDLSSFDTSAAKSMLGMFQDCSKLKTVYVSDAWTTAGIAKPFNGLFSGCVAIVGGNGTVFDAAHVDASYARVDKADAPGYFTLKARAAEPEDPEPEDPEPEDPTPEDPEPANPYNLGDETYSFQNYIDSDSAGHCFGMSITSAGYYGGQLDASDIGGGAGVSLYSLQKSKKVTDPICYYQAIQDRYSQGAIVAGGSMYLGRGSNIASDWDAVVNYVKGHEFDGTGKLQIGIKQQVKGGHAVNYLRYENVNGQDRIYAYDNNYPKQETYFYKTDDGRVLQAPVATYSGSLICIVLRDVQTYFSLAAEYDPTHALYAADNSISVQNLTPSYMDTDDASAVSVMYDIPADWDSVVIVPARDHASFTYMGEEYRFGAVDDDTRGVLVLANGDDASAGPAADFQVYGAPDQAKAGIADGATATVAGATYKVTSNAVATVCYQKAPKAKKSVTVPASVTIEGKSYTVTGIAKNAFKGTKAKTVTVKASGLTKKSVKGCFKGAKKLKTVKVKVGSKKTNKKAVKAYKKIFTKKNVGKKVTVK